jgi:hypothetical protein
MSYKTESNSFLKPEFDQNCFLSGGGGEKHVSEHKGLLMDD